MATNKIIMNGEEHKIEHQGLCVINLHGPMRTGNYDNCEVVSGEMVDGAIMYIGTDGNYYEHIYLDGVKYDLLPAINQDDYWASGYLLGRIIFIRNSWPDLEQ